MGIRNTDRLFPPDRFLFSTCVPNTVEVALIGSVEPDYENGRFSVAGLMDEVRATMEGWRSEHA